jgi:hypothetical protein
MKNKLKMSDYYIFSCPHCLEDIIVFKNELNCRIFRHAILKSNFTQVNPHASFEECQNLISNNLIFGCGKPFEIINSKENKLIAVECEYK